MLQIQNMALPLDGFPSLLEKRTARLLGVRPDQLQSLELIRLSIDARKKSDVHYVCTVRAAVDSEERVLSRCRDRRVSACQPATPYEFPAVRRMCACFSGP